MRQVCVLCIQEFPKQTGHLSGHGHDKSPQRRAIDDSFYREIREETVRRLLAVGGPLYQYIHPEGDGATFSRFKELINETLGTNLSYTDLYSGQFAGWLFNGSLEWSEANRQQADDLTLVDE